MTVEKESKLDRHPPATARPNLMAEGPRSRKTTGGGGGGDAQAAGVPDAEETKKASASMPGDMNSTPRRQQLRKELTEGACEKLFANMLAICIVTLCLWPLVKYGWL